MASAVAEAPGLVTSIVHSATASPLNLFLTAICIGLVYLIYKSALHDEPGSGPRAEPKKQLEPFPKGDLTLEELRKYDGHNEDGRVLLALNRQIYDVTKGSRFYGPEGPYAPMGGRDATRALALFTVDAVKDEWDDYSDLTVSQMNTIAEWNEQFQERYEYVGKLVRSEKDKATPVEPGDDEPDSSSCKE